jgi:hypothetical protein
VKDAEAQKEAGGERAQGSDRRGAGRPGLCTWKAQKRAAHTVKESTSRVLRLLNDKEG